jgi:putative ABC transport system substrate-binding protein
MAEDILLKLVELLHEALPAARRIAVMTNPTNPSHPAMLDSLRKYAVTAGFSIEPVAVASPADLDMAFAGLSQWRPDALFVLIDNSLLALTDTINARALTQRVPIFGTFAIEAATGALFSYSRDSKEAFRSVAMLVKRILNGTNPAELPVMQPTSFELIVNMRAAKALDIAIPPSILVRADKVIE